MLAGLTARAQNTFTLNATPPILSAAGGSTTFTVALGYQASVSAISVKVLAPSSQWTYGGNAGVNPPQIVPRVGDTGNVGDGYGFLYFTIPAGTASYSFTLRYPARLTSPQVFQATATLSGATGDPTILLASATVSQTPVAPAIATQPGDVTVGVGSSANFSVSATGTAPLAYQWRRNGAAIPGATGSSYTVSSVQLAEAASYDVAISNASGSVVSRAAKLSVTTSPVSPSVETQPENTVAAIAGAASFSVVTSGTPAPTFRWQRLPAGSTTWVSLANTTTYSGVATATLSIRGATAAMNGEQFRCLLTNSAGSTTTREATLTVGSAALESTVKPYARLGNLSVRATAGSGDQSLIVGFVISGTGNKQVLVRGIGSTLAQFGVGGTLDDPTLSLYNSARACIGTNDNWGGSATLSRSFTQVGAFSLPVSSKDAALSMALPAGACSAQIVGVGGATGISLAEVYDADADTSASRFVNLSARNHVGSGDAVLVVGFAIGGNSSESLLIRGIGPALTDFGVRGALPDPQIKLFNQQGQPIDENDDWGGTARLVLAFSQTGAFPLATGSKDAALLVTLQPGVYTAQVSGVANSTGIALIEVYEVR
jgi:hypothetical protein